jgi:hypothetical protein
MLLENAILEALAYSDIFDFPLTVDEIHRFLVTPATKDEISKSIINIKEVNSINGFHFLAGRAEIVNIRLYRETASRKAFDLAMFYGRILGKLPFIRMVALTGSLAMLNLSKNPDMDYMLVAASGRVWTARAFAILLGKFSKLFGHTICPNLIISERALEWPSHDLYSAREFCQMIPITGLDMYLCLRKANAWVESFFPNETASFGNLKIAKASKFWDIPLRGRVGDILEAWEMKRKMEKFSKQPGFGEETVFTADVCQGNFDHHRLWTRIAYEEKLNKIGLQLSPKYLESQASE